MDKLDELDQVLVKARAKLSHLKEKLQADKTPLDELMDIASEVTFWKHEREEFPFACEAWWRDGDRGRKVSLRVGETTDEAVREVLKDIERKKAGVEV